MSLSSKDILLSGSFSGAGKISLGLYNILAQAKKIKKKVQKIKRNNIMIPNFSLPVFSEDNKVIHSTYCKVKSFLEINNDKDTSSINSSNEYENQNEEKKVFKGEKYKFYNLHRERLKYNKKKEIKKHKVDNSNSPGDYNAIVNISHKIKGIDWKYLTGRKERRNNDNKNVIDIIEQSYTQRINNDKNKGFIDMSKQTERNGIPTPNDLRLRYEKQLEPINFEKQKKKWIKFCKKPLIPVSPFSNNYKLPHLNKINKRLQKTMLNNKKKKKIFSSIFNRNSSSNLNYTLKRKNKNIKKEEKNYEPICELHPNYNAIEERVKMMVTYNKNKSENKYNKERNRFNEIQRINLNYLYDASKTYEKIYGRKMKSVPNFEKMISRPNDDKLPSFMKGNYNGMSIFLSTDKDLNDISDRRIDESYSHSLKKYNIILKKNDANRRKKQTSSDILKKFNNLYIDYFNSLKKK